jgi:hypothetical protein
MALASATDASTTGNKKRSGRIRPGMFQKPRRRRTRNSLSRRGQAAGFRPHEKHLILERQPEELDALPHTSAKSRESTRRPKLEPIPIVGRPARIDPDLKEFLDEVLIPALVRDALRELSAEISVAARPRGVAQSAAEGPE